MNAVVRSSFALAFAAFVSACGGQEAAEKNLAALDAELLDTGNSADPVIAAALEDQIMVDPSLASQANGDAVRPPAEPYSAPVAPDAVAKRPEVKAEGLMKAPAPGPCPSCKRTAASETLASLAESQQLSGVCGPLRYSAGWAAKLPPDLPLHPAAAVREAAGADAPGCQMRVVSYSVQQPLQTMIDWHYTRVTQAGLTAEHQSDGTQHLIGGTGRGNAAYIVTMTANGPGATDVDLILRR